MAWARVSGVKIWEEGSGDSPEGPEVVWSTDLTMFSQGIWDEGAGPGKWTAAGSANLPEDVMLHHAGRHVAAASHSAGSHDGEFHAPIFLAG